MDLLERERHVNALEGWLREAAAGQGRLVFVGGEAGIGKTVLIQAFCQVGGGMARVRLGACDALAMPRPLGPPVDIAHRSSGELQHLLLSGAPRVHTMRNDGKEPLVLLASVLFATDQPGFISLSRFPGRPRAEPVAGPVPSAGPDPRHLGKPRIPERQTQPQIPAMPRHATFVHS